MSDLKDLTSDEALLEELLKFYTFHHPHCFPPNDYPEGKCHCGLDDIVTKLKQALTIKAYLNDEPKTSKRPAITS